MSGLSRLMSNPFLEKKPSSAASSPGSSPPPSPGAPPKPWAKAKHLTTLTGGERKPSVADFHGDLVKEEGRKTHREFRRMLWMKILAFASVLLVGLLAGIAIGYWAIPHSKGTSTVTTEAATATTSTIAAEETINLEPEAKAVENGNRHPQQTQPQESNTVQVTASTTLPSIAASTSKAAISTFATIVKSESKTSSAASAATSISAAAADAGTYWQPTSGTSFQIQLSVVISDTSNLPSSIDVYETDLFDTPASTIAALHTAGKKVICYFSAGTGENWRDDYSQLTSADLGAPLGGWAGENWLNTQSANVRSIMVARLALAKSKGCDGVDPDNVDVYSYTDSGFTHLTTATSINYLTYLAEEAHSLGLAIGLKNAGTILAEIEPVMQYSISESCVQYQECDIYQPFVAAGKPAFNIQYPFGSDNSKTSVSTSIKKTYCTGGVDVDGFSIILKHRNLDKWVHQC